MEIGYSDRFKTAEKQHVMHLKSVYGEERSQMLARNKKLQKETNQRRKAIAIKRKREAQLEEKRRLEILSKRKEQIREATERYQRLNRHYDPKDYTDETYPKAEQGDGGPSLEEALRAIRSSSKSPYRQSSAGGGSSGGGGGGYSRQGSGYQRQTSSATSERTRQHAREVAARTQLQHRSVHNLHSSRNMFEQQLDQHQRHLVDQQQHSLAQFNAAIHEEMAGDRKIQGLEEEEDAVEETARLQRSGSVSSVDSLEAEAAAGHHGNHADRNNHPNYAQPTSNGAQQYTTSAGAQQYTTQLNVNNNYSSSTSGDPHHSHHQTAPYNASTTFVVHRSSGSPSVAVVPPSVVQPSSMYDVTLPNSQTPAGPDQRQAAAAAAGLSVGKYGEMRVEDVHADSAQEIVPGKAADPYGVITPSSNGRYNGQCYQDAVITNYNAAHMEGTGDAHYNADLYRQEAGKHAPQAGDDTWATPFPQSTNSSSTAGVSSKGQTNNVSNATNSGYAPSVNAVNLLSSAKPFSATTTATSLSNTPTTTYGTSVVSHYSKPMPAPSNVVTAPNSYHSIQSAAIGSAKPKQNPLFAVKKTVPVVMERDEDGSEEEGDDVQEESRPEPPPAPAKPKGILKKTAGSPVVKESTAAAAAAPVPRVRGGGYARRGLYSRSVKPTNHSVRDSIEVTREQLSSRQEVQKTKKRGVRWTDLTYEDEGDSQSGEDPIEEKVFEPAPKPAPPKPSVSAGPVGVKKSRPISAKVVTATPEVETNVRHSRSASAGTIRRGPFLRPHPPSQPPPTRGTAATTQAGTAQGGRAQPPSHPPTGRAHPQTHHHGRGDTRIPAPSSSTTSPNTRGYDSSAYTTPAATAISSAVPTTNGAGTTHGRVEAPQQNQPVYDANGIRLDRTPTDDEINWLWDKVRTCLNRESTTSSMATQEQQNARQAVRTSQQPRRGATTSATTTTTTPPARGQHQSNYQNNYMGSALPVRKKVSMDTLNSYASRRSNLLSQRRQQQPGIGAISYHTTTNEAIQPIQSSTTPNPTNTTYTDPNVSESMAAFLTAELLAQQPDSLSESQIEQAMHSAQQRQQAANASRPPSQKVPSALSIEEQRLMQSLDRLNERLQINDPSNANGPFVPRPPSKAQPANYDMEIEDLEQTQPTSFGSFKGKAPLSASKRVGVNMNGTVPRQQHRIGSAGANHTAYSNTTQTGHVRYR